MSWLEPLYNFAKNILNYKIIILLVVIFLGISAYYYNKIIKNNINKKYVSNKEFDNENIEEEKIATMYFFYTNWCPLCKKAREEWDTFVNNTQGYVKNVNIVFKEIDCDKYTDIADKFNVTGYPTIKLVYDYKTFEYDAKPDKNTLIHFLDSVL